MVKVSLYKQGSYPVNAAVIKKKLKNFFENRGIVSDAEVSVAIIGEKKMLEVGRKYLKDKKVHNVLSFTPDEIKPPFVFPPDGTVHLGEIMVCYPVVLEEAKKEGKMIDTKVYELVEHGAMHLLGIHHE